MQGDSEETEDQLRIQLEWARRSPRKEPWLDRFCKRIGLCKRANHNPARDPHDDGQVTRRNASRRLRQHVMVGDRGTKMTAAPIISIERARTPYPKPQLSSDGVEDKPLGYQSSTDERKCADDQAHRTASQTRFEHADDESTNHASCARRPSRFEAVEEVKENFTNLLRYNKLQSFYLGALIYSVINIALKFAKPQESGGVLGHFGRTTDTSQPTLNASSWTKSVHDSVSFGTCDQSGVLATSIALLTMLPLFLCIILAALKFAYGENARLRVASRTSLAVRLSWPHTFGLCLVAFQLYLFSMQHLVTANRYQPTVSATHLNSLLVLAYIQPLLFESAQSCLAQRFIGYLGAIVPAVIYLWRALNLSAGRQVAELSLLGVASALGFYRRAAFIKSVERVPFKGANQLIEAKVSLEHQRQQQETLLLSVLPAYVAEQVKRNMLKKTNSSSSSCSSFCSVAPPTPTANPAVDNTSSISYTCSPNPSQSPPVGAGSSLRIQTASERMSFSSSGQRNSFRRSSLQQQQRQQHQQQPCSVHLSQGPSVATSMLIPQLNVPQLPASVSSHNPAARRGFNELYIRTYNNVSLLYGDIVGFTRLCTQLSSSQLVRVLNDLFSRFDYLAEKHKIMRIKILGDCYYGVSGIPEFAVMGAKSRATRNDNHAINCVNMGLDMIQYIRCFNIERASNRAKLSSSSRTTNSNSSDIEVRPVQTSCSFNTGSTPLPEFELNMRIGVHTGHIHSGVIGLKKWQFDVWSNDVSIAMHCESSGKAGRVQVTDATKQQLNGAFSCEPVPTYKRDSFLVSRDVFTYLIKEPTQKLVPSNSPASPSVEPTGQCRASDEEARIVQTSLDQAQTSSKEADKTGDDLDNIRNATIGTIRQTMLSSIEGCSSSLVGCALSHHDLSSFSLTYRDKSLDKLYLNRISPNLMNESLIVLAIFILSLPLSNLLFIPDSSQITWSINALIVLSTLVFLTLALFYAPNKLKATKRCTLNSEEEISQVMPIEERLESCTSELDTVHDLESWPRHQVIVHQLKPISLKIRARACCMRFSRSMIRAVAKHVNLRGSKYRRYSAIFFYLAVVAAQLYLLIKTSGESRIAITNEHHLQLTMIIVLMALDSSSSFLTYGSRACIIIALILTSFFMPRSLKDDKTTLVSSDQGKSALTSNNSSSSSKCSLVDDEDRTSLVLLFVFSLWSLAYARQLEYTSRANFLWRTRLNVDHEELEYISGINKVLLENILPSHVVQYFLTQPGDQLKSHLNSSLRATYMRMSFSNMRSFNEDLYNEQHENVAVMFASIPHFYEFYDESDISKQGLGCIALLNEIICDFDKLLLKNKFSRIEKIKTIGSTYMAAAGLRPSITSTGRNSTASSVMTNSALPEVQRQPRIANKLEPTEGLLGISQDERRPLLSQQKLNLNCMIQFAANLMSTLNGINKQSFQGFKLRIGVNTGPVIAGVIGAQRPFYDIWGDCVNIASRMESLGQVGRIQVEERTAMILMESLCPETYSIVKRGSIDVKGKGGMVTYFVDRRPAKDQFNGASSGIRPEAD